MAVRFGRMYKRVEMPRFLLGCWLVFFTSVLAADETFDAVMHRMAANSAVAIPYRETKAMELLDQPWQASGVLYALAPDLMVKEQIEPERVLMAVDKDTLLYFDSANEVRHQAELELANPMAVSIALFKALMTADRKTLQTTFHAQFTTSGQRWTLLLAAEIDDEPAVQADISGTVGAFANRINITQADGDTSLITLDEPETGPQVQDKIQALAAEARGQ